MRAIHIKAFGGPDQLIFEDLAPPRLRSQELLVNIKATALNRADILQRKGFYPPPPGASQILGLEMAGTIKEVGPHVTKWKTGDRVFGLLSGGGYAEYCAIHEDLAIPIPDAWSFIDAAAVPEAFLTAFQAIGWLSKLKPGESILIHAGASGVGTAAIQLAKVMQAGQIFVTASRPKHKLCKDLGAKIAINYRKENFEACIQENTEGRGVNVIIDFLAASYIQQNLNTLSLDGRLVMLALMGGQQVENLMIGNILKKRLTVMGSTLRSRSLGYKIHLTRDFCDFAMPKFISGDLIPVIDTVFDWEQVADAHRYMEDNKNKGKIILTVSEE